MTKKTFRAPPLAVEGASFLPQLELQNSSARKLRATSLLAGPRRDLSSSALSPKSFDGEPVSNSDPIDNSPPTDCVSPGRAENSFDPRKELTRERRVARSKPCRVDSGLNKSSSLPSLPRQVQEFFKRQQLAEDIGNAHIRRDIRELRILLSRWPSDEKVPAKVLRARADLKKWDIVEGRMPVVLREIVTQRDVSRLQHVMHELDSFGIREMRGLREAQDLLRAYKEQCEVLQDAVTSCDAEGIRDILNCWDFAEPDEHLEHARSLLKELDERDEQASHQQAATALGNLLKQRPTDLVKIRDAIDAWPCSGSSEDAPSILAEACTMLADHQTAIEAALSSSTGWDLKHLWDATGSGYALGESNQDLICRVTAALDLHDAAVAKQCKHLEKQKQRLRDRNYTSWLPELVAATTKTALAATLHNKSASFWPCSWSYPKDALDKIWDQAAERNIKALIVKPSLGSQGWGISIALTREDLLRKVSNVTEAEALIQEYVAPLLLGGFKWDMRIYVLIVPSPTRGLVSFLASDGLARVCAEPYHQPESRNQHRMTMHLTNYTINKTSEKYQHATSAEDGLHGCKRSLRAVFSQIEEQAIMGLSVASMWEDLRAVARETVDALLTPHVVATREASNVEGALEENFHLLGFDVLLHETGKPCLLEVNTKPSLDFDEVRPLAISQSRADVNQVFLKEGRRKASTQSRRPCRCGALASVHTHNLCPVDLAVKGPVIDGALSIAQRAMNQVGLEDLGSWTEGTVFDPL